MAEYPALYTAASKLSADSQRFYLMSLRLEYVLLITCSVMSLNSPKESAYYYLYAFLFVGALFTFGHRFFEKPEQLWYKGRALAESVKTSTWKYMMKAAPFESADIQVASATFRDSLKGIVAANQFAGQKLPPDAADKVQITGQMNSIRALTCKERLSFYIENRIREQRTWYAKKAKHNRVLARRWAASCIIVYTIAVVSTLLRAQNPTWNYVSAEPLIALASAIIGWMQTKRFNELASSYTLTAHEIGFVQAASEHISSDLELASFVFEAEFAFSREHTQWLARQND